MARNQPNVGVHSNRSRSDGSVANVEINSDIESELIELVKAPARVAVLHVHQHMQLIHLVRIPTWRNLFYAREHFQNEVRGQDICRKASGRYQGKARKPNFRSCRVNKKPFANVLKAASPAAPKFQRQMLETEMTITSVTDDVPFFFKQDSGLHSGERSRTSDMLWACKEFPR